MKPFVILIIILATGLGLLLYNHDSGQTFGMANEDFGRLIYLMPIAALLGAGILAGRRGQASEVVRNIAIWLLIAVVMVAGYLYRDDAKGVAARLTAGLIPGSAVSVTRADGRQEVIINKAMGHHFSAIVEVEGRKISMLVDTGASSIVLTQDDARAIGLNPETLDFRLRVSTANGEAMAAPVRLDNVAIGPIRRHNIRALVAEKGKLEESLLGMSFLSTLGSLQIKSDELRLTD